MSVQQRNARLTVPQVMARKGNEPIVCLTSYHAHTAALIDPHVDLLLVGDSLGMVMYGMENTLGVTLDMMIAHGAAVVRGSGSALVVVDMPFGTYEESRAHAFHNAARVMKETGCQAIKLEGGERMADTVHHLTQRGIPVMGHIGLTPQNVNVMGGFKTQGRNKDEWPQIERDALALAEAGAFAVVLEGIAAPLADKIPPPYRCRPLALARRPVAMGKFWSLRICCACRPACRNLSKNSPVWASRLPMRQRPMRAMCGRVNFLNKSTLML